MALSYIGRLYEVEKYGRKNELSPEEIYELRREKAKPILEEFNAWMDKLKPPGHVVWSRIDTCVFYLKNFHMLQRSRLSGAASAGGRGGAAGIILNPLYFAKRLRIFPPDEKKKS